MRRERRQELKTNELAQSLQGTWAFLNKHGTYLLAAVVVVALIFAVTAYLSHQRRVAAADEWAQLGKIRAELADETQTVKSLESLKTLAAEVDNPEIAKEALLLRARVAANQALKNPSAPDVPMLDAAREAYNDLLDRFGRDSMLEGGSALMRLANLEADYFASDFDPAHKEKTRKYLEQIKNDARFAGTPFHAEALARLNDLDKVFTPVRIVEAPPPPMPTTAPVGPPAVLPPLPPLPDDELFTPAKSSDTPLDPEVSAPDQQPDATEQSPSTQPANP